MQSFTVTQWAIVALVFVAGWLLGLASHSGGRKWRERYAAEREAHAQARRDADGRVAELETQHRATLAERERLDRERAQVAQSDRITVAPRRSVTAGVAPPVQPAGERRGWFDWGPRRT
jgi:hypothetical protein